MSAFVNGIWKSGNNRLLKLCNELGLPTANRGVATVSLRATYAPVCHAIGPNPGELSVFATGLISASHK